MSSCCSPLARQSVNPMSPWWWQYDNNLRLLAQLLLLLNTNTTDMSTVDNYLMVSSFWKMICSPIKQLQVAPVITNEEGPGLLKEERIKLIFVPDNPYLMPQMITGAFSYKKIKTRTGRPDSRSDLTALGSAWGGPYWHGCRTVPTPLQRRLPALPLDCKP